MNILSINTGHDASVCLFNDFDLVVHCKEERVNRIKTWGQDIPWQSLRQVFKKCSPEKIDVLVLLRGVFPLSCYRRLSHRSATQQLRYWVKDHLLNQPILLHLDSEMMNSGKWEESLLDFNKIRAFFGLRSDCEIQFSNHHLSHALPTIFYSPEWERGLAYTADGVGDGAFYSIYSFNQEGLQTRLGGDQSLFEEDHSASSLGRLYGAVTRVSGYQDNRHEGKITGLAAYGKPVLLEELRKRFYVNSSGMIESTFKKYREVVDYIATVAQEISKEDLACSVQVHLQETMLASIDFHRQATDSDCIGLSGGVFGNVRLNQVIAEASGIKDVFVYPAMGDEGLPVGAALNVGLKKWGWKEWMSKRRDLGTVYYGQEFTTQEMRAAAEKFKVETVDGVAKKAATLIHEGKICAIFTKGMEYGPRSLGARSILANPKDKNINKTLNDRLTRTEFMPFAPVVRAERLTEIFKCPPQSVRATQYMTITCDVQGEWAERIPAVVHVDGTARPQSIRREDNPLYYDILQDFEVLSSLPCLINTSFNAHEEPIINTPLEALRALAQGRVDYLITEELIISAAGEKT